MMEKKDRLPSEDSGFQVGTVRNGRNYLIENRTHTVVGNNRDVEVDPPDLFTPAIEGVIAFEAIWEVLDYVPHGHEELTNLIYCEEQDIDFPLADAHLGKTLFFAYRCVKIDGERTPWSEIISASIPKKFITSENT